MKEVRVEEGKNRKAKKACNEKFELYRLVEFGMSSVGINGCDNCQAIIYEN